MKRSLIISLLVFISVLFAVKFLNAQILISEIADPADNYLGRFIEIYNAGTGTVNFSTDIYYISRQVNGGSTWNEVQLTGTIAPGQAYVIVNDTVDFYALYGFYPELQLGGTGGNGDDAYFLYHNGNHSTGTLFDIFGQLDTDGTGMAWEYTDAHAVRNFSITSPNIVWTASEWIITTGNIADMTPGVHSAPAQATKLNILSVNGGNNPFATVSFNVVIQSVDINGIPAQATTDVNLQLSLATGTGILGGVITGTIITGNSSATISGVTYNSAETGVSIIASDLSGNLEADTSELFNVIYAPPVPAIVITEIMYNPPESGTDSLEFIELYNNDTIPVDLTGYSFSAGITYTFSALTLNPGEYIVLSSGSGGADAFYGITSLHWTGSLSNSGEAVVLIDSYGQIVDSVKYGIASPWPTAANGSGASLEFCFPNLDNSIAANWTASTSFIDTISTGQAIYASPGTNCITPEPTRLKIISINNGFSPIIDTPFDVVVHAQDNFGVDANALSDVNITLNLATGTGVLGGTLTGTIAAGTNAVTISGVTYNIAESGVSIFVTDDSSALSADTSNIFTVLGSPPVPAKLSIVSVNNGTDPVINTLFDVVIEVRDSADSPVAISSEVSITLSLASGTGVLGGTTTGTVSTGNSSITISGINYNVAEAGVSIVASDDSLILAPDTSALFDVLETPPVPAIIITEIMYNPPESVTDSLEFLELYNNDIIPVDMTGYNFSAGVTYIFGALTLNPGEYIVLSSGSGGADAFYGTTSLHWTGALSNSGEAIVLIDSYGQIVDSVYYDDSNPWPTAANGNGSSLTLCNPSADNSIPENWSASTEYVDTVAGIEVYASPGTGCTISFPTGLKVISVNGNIDPYVNIPFDIIVQAIDSTGQPAIVNSPVFVDLSVASGNGLLGGLFTGIITTGNSTVNFNGITYNLAEDSVIIRASDQNYVLASGLSESFNVVELPPTAKIVITEIMYNPPESSNDSLEFIELYNNDTLPVDMTGYSFSAGITYTFSALTLNPGEYIVLSSGSGGADAFYGITSLHWTGSLSNSGEAVVLIDSYGQIVDSVKYGITSPWPDANENGYSIEFCYPYMDNTVPANWSQATNYVDTVAGMSVYASPGQGCNIPVPEKLAIILVNNNVNPIVNVPFNVVVQSQDIDGNAINSISNINIGLSLVTGSGNLGGTLNGTVTAGTNSVVISGVIYDMVDTAVSIMAIDITAVLDTGISYLFDVTAPPPPPVKLVITSVNGGIDPNVNTPFNVVVQTRDSSDNLSNVIQNTTVVLSLVTGSGTLGGTLTGTLNTGNNTLMLSGVTYNIEDINVSILASDQSGNLLAGTSGYFNVIDASSVLSPGDIAIIQFRSDPADGFAFVALDNIPGNTEIKFTDKGWTEADTLSSGENTLIWTCPAGGILPGTVVTWQVTTGVNLGSVTGSLDGIDDTGDQILVYQGSSGNPAFIYALSTVPWTLSGSISDPYHSYLPDSLQNKYTAIHFSGADNGYYKLTPISGTPEELKHSISDTINWFTTNNSSVEFFKPASYWSFIIGIKEFSIGNQLIKLYPNPAENFIIIENIPEKEILQIIDVNGIVHYTEIINSERILVNIQRFGKSIYLARIIMESGEYMNLRFVKY